MPAIYISQIDIFVHPDYLIEHSPSAKLSRLPTIRELWNNRIDQLRGQPDALMFYVSRLYAPDLERIFEPTENLTPLELEEKSRVERIIRSLGQRSFLFDSFLPPKEQINEMLEERKITLQNPRIFAYGEIDKACVWATGCHFQSAIGIPSERAIFPYEPLSLSMEDVFR